jgi:8-oxo-dGTP pyrophosphatase MutT (NUDIX family)
MSDWRARLVSRFAATQPSHDITDWRLSGMSAEQSQQFRRYFPERPTAAAVLIPFVERHDGITIVLTQRAQGLKNHAAQVSFPGGRVDPGDDGARGAALREAHEEIGLAPEHVEVFGFLPDHLVISGYRVTPVLAFVDPAARFVPNPKEVASVFEVPLTHIFEPANHLARTRRFDNGDEVQLFDIPYREHNIWGATAGMLLTLYRLMTDAPRDGTSGHGFDAMTGAVS